MNEIDQRSKALLENWNKCLQELEALRLKKASEEATMRRLEDQWDDECFAVDD